MFFVIDLGCVDTALQTLQCSNTFKGEADTKISRLLDDYKNN